MERERLREREPEPARVDFYESSLRACQELRDRAHSGRIVIRAKESGWRQSRQGYAKYFLHPEAPGIPTGDWTVFVHEIHSHSGRHRHQGGLVIFVLDGKGYTLVDGKRVDWEAGDLLLLPVKPNGVEHQHFNLNPRLPCKWIAFIYVPFRTAMGSLFEQVEISPDWERQQRDKGEHV